MCVRVCLQAAWALWGEKPEQPWPVGPTLRAVLQMDAEPAAKDTRGPHFWQRGGGRVERQQLSTEAAAAARVEAKALSAADHQSVGAVDTGGIDWSGDDY